METVLTTESYQESLTRMSLALHDLDRHVIGLAKCYGSVELILRKDDDILVTYRIGALLGSSTDHYGVQDFKGTIHMFPEGKSLADMKRDPFVLNEFCETHKI